MQRSALSNEAHAEMRSLSYRCVHDTQRPTLSHNARTHVHAARLLDAMVMADDELWRGIPAEGTADRESLLHCTPAPVLYDSGASLCVCADVRLRAAVA